jgi:hypothetical protein
MEARDRSGEENVGKSWCMYGWLLALVIVAAHGEQRPPADLARIVVNEAAFGPRFSLDDSLISRARLGRILAEEAACESHSRKGRHYGDIAGATGVFGGSILLYGIGVSIFEREARRTPLTTGLSILALDFVGFNFLNNRNLRLGVAVFNDRDARRFPDAGSHYKVALEGAIP